MTETNRQGCLRARLVGMVQERRGAWQRDVHRRFESPPKTLLRLYTGASFGRQLQEL